MRKILFYKKASKENRPYYIVEDNVNSNIRISKLVDFSIINEINDQRQKSMVQVKNNYFDTPYLAKVKQDSIKYPNYDKRN